MITQIANIHLFYPMLFIVLTILIVSVSSVIKSRSSNMTFKDMFSKSSDNAKEVTIDTTTKMADMHNKVIPMQYTSVQEKEFHTLECGLKELKENVEELKEKVNTLLDRVIAIEQRK